MCLEGETVRGTSGASLLPPLQVGTLTTVHPLPDPLPAPQLATTISKTISLELNALRERLVQDADARATTTVSACVGTYVPGPPHCTYAVRVPASCVLYVPEAQGSRTSLGRTVPYVPRTVESQEGVIKDDGDKTREAVGTVGDQVTALGGNLAGQITSIMAAATANGEQLGNIAAAQVRVEGEAKQEKLTAKTLAAKQERLANQEKLAASVAAAAAAEAAAEAEEETLKVETAAKAAAAQTDEAEKAATRAQQEITIALGAALEANTTTIEKVKEAALHLCTPAPLHCCTAVPLRCDNSPASM